MTQEDKPVSEQKKYVKPNLINYGDLSLLTQFNVSSQGVMDGGSPSSRKTGPTGADAVEETFERFDRSSSSSDSSGRSGRRGGE